MAVSCVEPTVRSCSAAPIRAAVPPSGASDFIDGSTLLYPVIGHPVAQVKAPMLYNALFTTTGFDAAVVPMDIAPADLPAVVQALFRMKNVPGVFVTIPHKAAVVALLDDCSDAVRIAGACNAVRRCADGRLFGDLFDGIGFVRAVDKHGFGVAGSRCLVVGAGGAGAAIAAALADAGAATIRLADIRTSHACALAKRMRAHYSHCLIEAGPAALAGFALVVNATPLGMDADDPLPIDADQIGPDMTIAEIVMKREITPLVAAARAKGCRTVLGREMLREQMPLYLDFFGLPALPADGGNRGAEPASQRLNKGAVRTRTGCNSHPHH